MIFFWILVALLICLVVYGLDQQSELGTELASPRKFAVSLVIRVLRSLRQMGRNIAQGFKRDIGNWRERAGLKNREQRDSEQKD